MTGSPTRKSLFELTVMTPSAAKSAANRQAFVPAGRSKRLQNCPLRRWSYMRQAWCLKRNNSGGVLCLGGKDKTQSICAINAQEVFTIA